MKKKFIATIACLSLIMGLSTSAMAWSIAPVDMDTVEMKVDFEASDWAIDELALAYEADLIPSLTGNPEFTDTLTRIQFAELIVNMVELLDDEIVAASTDTFTDCSSEAVLKAYEAGIVNGTSDTTFEPSVKTNREEIATMIARSIDYIATQTGTNLAPNTGDLSAFTDASEVSSWAYESVSILAANGIMNGTSTTTLSPSEETTVEMGIVLVYRLFSLV